ncbi:Asp-tRNA(Asn)/Glu-tRNA(Gln) amidotransferase subunit GatC [Tepidimicrobium xylanilyticum]|uniref:Aspartyl/glutamyl-tRNA(Asn/Gln) amidotransferase subunit C n=1 Tax=Tepidimicrobium xylanilyticum TaxID=1123352 RepID=A0A1H3B9A2_9FIRM|nr:Asp-tRNA(Asn)/Glu-tRNA(Gln) amidotransferase subunit GatC [Tepidimicrobium xylanilyticum]GMG96967.1 aspartyl/glutamyl-tRNA(Asn/Gln) amidotransferase subunit C [Tepidimicrobium xylanilyticum]SDX38375.1 aspartyl/glutamyl-tRNA(Asn/Gln) amidotransferase subunit C [Tepidimicrobium xylanilyticum]
MITKKQVDHIADLCKLKLSEEEKERIIYEFALILQSLEEFNKVDLENVEPTFGVNKNTQRFREDIVEPTLSRQEVLANTVEKQCGYFKLLNIVE